MTPSNNSIKIAIKNGDNVEIEEKETPHQKFIEEIANDANIPAIHKEFFSKLPANLFEHFNSVEILKLKCRNRECRSLRGYKKKPNSMYCSPKCQSREQNLRQGRVKSAKFTPVLLKPISKSTEDERKSEEEGGNIGSPYVPNLEKLNISFLISQSSDLNYSSDQ